MSNQSFIKPNAKCRDFDWEQVLKKYFPDLKLNTQHQPCPHCGGKDRFRLFPDWPETGASYCNQCDSCDGIGLLMKSLNMSFPNVMNMLDGNIIPAGVKPQPAVKAIQADSAKRLRYLKNYLQQGKPLQVSERSKASQYLNNRGLRTLFDRNDMPDNLLYAPSVMYKHTDEPTQYFGCLLAAVHDVEASLVGVHRIYLSADGYKAPVSTPKKSLPAVFEGAMNGAAVRLYPAKHSLCITEGIETALAVRCMRPSLPVWATLTAYGMRTLRLPAEICDVHIFADHDLSGAGAKAVYWLATRLRREGRQVKVYWPSDYLPANTYGDFLDVWCMGVTSYE